MKGVILAGGKGTRLRPLTNWFNKHSLPVCGEPMIFNPITAMVRAGITDIMVVLPAEKPGMLIEILGDGSIFTKSSPYPGRTPRLTYRIQSSFSGTANSAMTADGWIGNDECFLLAMGDNILEDKDALIYHLSNYHRLTFSGKKEYRGAFVLVKPVEEPSRYGVVEIAEDNFVVDVEEKPENPKSSLALTGFQIYDSRFFQFVDKLLPSVRGEYELTDVLKAYAEIGELRYGVLDCGWVDAGTHESLAQADQMLKKSYREYHKKHWSP